MTARLIIDRSCTPLRYVRVKFEFAPEIGPGGIEGRQALFVMNLEPREMAGMVSEGMLFDIGFLDGVTSALAVPEKPVPNGARTG